jgi:hypothetical protein
MSFYSNSELITAKNAARVFSWRPPLSPLDEVATIHQDEQMVKERTVGACRDCVQWVSGECRFPHARIFVKFPDELNVPNGNAVLLTEPDFGCAEFQCRNTK